MGAVRGAFTRAKGQVTAAIAGAKGKVTAAGATAKGQVTTWKGSATTKTKSAVDDAANAATQTGADFANQGKSAVTASGQKVKGTIDSAASSVQGQSGGGGGANEAAAEGNAKVASKVSGETSGKVKSQGGQVVSGVNSQGGKVGSAFQAKGKEAATAIKQTLPDAMANISAVKQQADSAVAKGVSAGQTSLSQVGSQTSASLAAQQGAATKQISSQVASTKQALAKGAGTARQAVQAQYAASMKGLKTSAAKMRALVNKAPVTREDADGVSGEVKGQLKDMSARGIVAGGKTAKLAANATGGAAKQAKTGLAAGASGASSSASQTATGAQTGASSLAANVGSQVQSTAKSATAAGDKTVTNYTGKVKSSKDKVKGKLSEGLNKTKTEMSAHEAKVQGGTAKIPGDNAGKVSQGQAKVNAASKEEPKKPGGLWGKIVSAAKWVAEKLKAAFEFVAKLLTDPGFWVSLIVAVALTAFVIATFGSGLAVLVVAGAIIGAISSGAGQIVTNLASGKKWNEGLGTAMLIGGVTGLIPGLGKGLGTIGSKVAGKFGTSVANSTIGRLGSKLASSALGRGAQALGRGLKNVGGKLASLGSKGLSTRAGRIISAPFRGAANLGTRLGNATREGLERRFPNVVKPNAAGAKPTSPTRAAHEEPSTTGRKPEVTDDADAVARDAAEQSAKVENPPPLQERIDRVTGVSKGPEYDRAQAQLKEFYKEQQEQALASGRNVHNTRVDQMVDRHGRPMTNPDGSPYGYTGEGNYDAYRFTNYDDGPLTQINMKVKLDGQAGVGPDDLARVKDDALRGVDEYYNGGKVLPNGDRVHVNVEFVDDAAQAHTRVAVHPGPGGADQVNWYTQSHPTTHAHELGHGMGLMDEYVDPRAFARGGGNTSNVHTDDSLMGDYWQRGPGGNAIPDHAGNPTVRPGTEVKPRHWQQIQDDLDAAAAGGRPPAHGGSTPGPRPNAPQRVSDLPPSHQQILQETGADPAVVNRLLAAGVDPDKIALRAIESPQAVEVLEGLTKRGVQDSVANKVASNAAKLDEQFPGLLRNINDLSASPKLHNPQALNGLLDDISKGKKGAATELDRAAQRLREGHDVQLGAQNRVGGDVVDHTDQEVMQLKDITSEQTDAVARNMDDAANQLAGKGSKGQRTPGEKDTEVPPTRDDGTPYTRTIDLTIRNPKNPLHGAKREEIEAFVRAEMQHVTERGSVDKVRVWVDGKPFDIEGPF